MCYTLVREWGSDNIYFLALCFCLFYTGLCEYIAAAILRNLYAECNPMCHGSCSHSHSKFISHKSCGEPSLLVQCTQYKFGGGRHPNDRKSPPQNFIRWTFGSEQSKQLQGKNEIVARNYQLLTSFFESTTS